MKPVGDHVLVTPIETEDSIALEGGKKLWLPVQSEFKEKPNRGEVVAVGTGRIMSDGKVREIDLMPGQKVLFSKYAGNEFALDADTVGTKKINYVILSYDDILVVLD